MNNSTNENIKLWVYLLFFLAGILSFPLALIFTGIFSGTLTSLQNAFASSGYNILLGFYIYLMNTKTLSNPVYIIFILPQLICSLFFAIGMYVFRNKSYVFASKAFVISFVASFFLLPIIFTFYFYILLFFYLVISFVASFFISPYSNAIYFFVFLFGLFLIILVHLAAFWLIKAKYPSMMFPLKAFISSFYILNLILLIMWGSAILFFAGSRAFGY